MTIRCTRRRVPQLVRWPGKIKPGTIINDIFSQEDWLPTLLAAANGGVDTNIQAESPGQDRESNWLPAEEVLVLCWDLQPR